MLVIKANEVTVQSVCLFFCHNFYNFVQFMYLWFSIIKGGGGGGGGSLVFTFRMLGGLENWLTF